eukprot:scaffold151671_cov70-Attheya_sp.AAC.3
MERKSRLRRLTWVMPGIRMHTATVLIVACCSLLWGGQCVSAATSLRETKQGVGTKNSELKFEFGEEVSRGLHSRGSDDSSLRKTNLRRLRVGDGTVANPNSRKTGVYPAKDL